MNQPTNYKLKHLLLSGFNHAETEPRQSIQWVKGLQNKQAREVQTEAMPAASCMDYLCAPASQVKRDCTLKTFCFLSNIYSLFSDFRILIRRETKTIDGGGAPATDETQKGLLQLSELFCLYPIVNKKIVT